jgi:hypothetical protein
MREQQGSAIRRHGVSVGALTLSLLLVAGCGVAGSGSGVDGPLGAALGRVREEGSYRFRSEVTQVVSPVASIVNAGRSASTQSLVLEGVTDVDASATELSVSAGGGESLGLRIVDGVSYRRDGEGSWVEAAAGTADQVASAGDLMGYLGAARDVVDAGAQSSGGRLLTRYVFGIDPEAYTEMAAGQLHQVGRSVSGVSVGMTGSGELWVNGDGLPVRELLSLTFPGGNGVGATSTQMTVEFSEFGTAQVPGVARASSWWRVDVLSGLQVDWLLALSALVMLLLAGVAGSRWLGWSVLSTRSVSMVVVVGLVAPLVVFGRADADAPAAAASVTGASALDSVVADSIKRSGVDRDVAGDVRAYQRSQLADPHLDRLAAIGSPELAMPQESGEPTDTTTDTDADGLTDFVELGIGTDPRFADTDDDGVDDLVEVDGFTVACSANTGAPVRWFGDPGNPDSNGDGVADGSEWSVDSDGDCTPDLFADDNDGDGVPDRVDSAPLTVLGQDHAFDGATPLELTVNGLDSSKDLATFVDFQLRPTDGTHLKFAPSPDGTQSRLDWPADTAGQIMELNDGVDDNDVTLIPMLEIMVPATHTLPAVADLEVFGVRVDDAPNGSRTVYVPLTVVRDPDSGADVALGGRMLYSSTADWSDAQDVKLLWLVQVNNDVPCDVDAADAVAKRCTDVGDPDVGYIYDSPQIVQAYYEPWTLTGLTVTEEHGADMAVIYEDPAVDDDIVSYLPSWGLEQVLTERFLSTTPGTNNFEITSDNIATLIDLDLNGGRTLYDLPNIFQVEVNSYRTFDEAVVKTASDVLTDVLDDVFTPKLGGEAFIPLITTAYSSTSRSFNLDAGSGYADVTASALTMIFPSQDSALKTIPLQTAGGVKWNPYCPTGGQPAWTPCSADALTADVDRQSAGEAIYDPDFDQAGAVSDEDVVVVGPAPDLAEGERQLALMHAVTMMTGRSLTTKITTTGDTVIALHESYESGERLANTLVRVGQTLGPLGYKFVAGRIYQKTLFQLAETMRLAGSVANAELGTTFRLKYFLRAKLALESFTAAQRFADSITDQTVTDRLVASLRKMSTARRIGVAGGGMVAALGIGVGAAAAIAGTTSDSITGSLIKVGAVGISLASAAQAASEVVVVAKTLKALNQTRNLLGASSAKYLGQSAKGSVVGAVIATTITWGFFIHQMTSAGITAFSPAFNAVLAETIAATLYIALLTVLSLSVVGNLIVALIFLVDVLITFICGLDDKDDCATISSSVTDAITIVLYGASPMVDVAASDLVSVKAPKITLTNPELGYVAGNAATISLPVDTTVTHTSPSAWQMAFYTWLYSRTNIQSADFEHAISAPDAVTPPAAVGPGTWDSVTVARTWSGKDLFRATRSETVEIDAADVVTFDTAGLNQSFPYTLNSAYTLPTYECWTVPGFPVFIFLPLCYSDTLDDTTSSEMTPLVYDILPASLSAFVATTVSATGEVRLAWDSAFEPMKDVDGDELLAARYGGFDPDDAKVDTDGDGMSDRRELELRAEGVAVAPGAGDADFDGLSDLDEVKYGTDPSVADTDNDGLSDGVEARHVVTTGGVSRLAGGWDVSVAGRTVRVYSDPLVPDSDSDGISDQAEKELAGLTAPADRADDQLRPYHPRVVNTVPIGILMDVPAASGFVAPGDTVDVETDVATSVKLAPSVLNVSSPSGSAAPALLDFDADTFVDGQVRSQTTPFTVPRGVDEVTIDATVRAWLPTIGEPVVSLAKQTGTAAGPTTFFSGLFTRSADSINQFVIAATVPASGTKRDVVRMDPRSIDARTSFVAFTNGGLSGEDPDEREGLGASASACNSKGTCLGVWSRAVDVPAEQPGDFPGGDSSRPAYTFYKLQSGTVAASGQVSSESTHALGNIPFSSVSVASDGQGFEASWTINGVNYLGLSNPRVVPVTGLVGATTMLWAGDRYVVIGQRPGITPVECLKYDCTRLSTEYVAYDTTTGKQLVIGEFNDTSLFNSIDKVAYDPGRDLLLVVGFATGASENRAVGSGSIEGVLWPEFTTALNCVANCTPPTVKELYVQGSNPAVAFDPRTADWVVASQAGNAAVARHFGGTDLTPGADIVGPLSATRTPLSVECPAASAFPVAALGFEELPGATTFADATPNRLDAVTDAGNALQAGAPGAPGATRSHLAARFADRSAVLHVPSPKLLEVSPAVSLAFWVRVDPSSSTEPFTIAWDAQKALRIRPDTGVVQWQWGATSTQSSRVINDAKWHFVVATHSGTTIRLWVDGFETAPASGSDAGNDFPDELVVSGGGSPVTVDQLQFYNTALGTKAVDDLVKGVSPVCMMLDGTSGGSWTTIASQISDPRGGFLTASALLKLRIDDAAPTSTVVAPSAPIGAGTYMLAGTTDDQGGSGVSKVEVQVDGGPWVTADGKEAWVLPIDLSDGDHQIVTRVTDSVRNTATSGSVVLRVDLTAPTVTLTALNPAVRPDTDATTGAVTVAVTGTASDEVSGLAGGRVDVRVVQMAAGDTPAEWQQASVGIDGRWSIDYVLSSTPQPISGTYTVSVRAVDVVGNETALDAASGTVVLDSVAPTASLWDANLRVGFLPGGAVLSGAVSDSGGVGVAAVEVSFTPLESVIDPSFDQTTRVWLRAQVASSSWSLPVPADLEGMFQIDLRSSDLLGNVRVEDRIWSGIVDTRAPRLTLNVEPKGRERQLPVPKFEVAYECVAEDLFLDEATFDCPGKTVQPVVRGFLEPSPLRDALDAVFPGQAFVTELSSRYTKWESQQPRTVQFRACDSFGNCAEEFGAVQQALRAAGLILPDGVAAMATQDPNAVVVSPSPDEHVAAATTTGVKVDVVVAVEAPASIKTIEVLIDDVVVAERNYVAGDRIRHDETIAVDVVTAGRHTVSVSVVDHAGGVDMSVPFGFFVDVQAPVLTFSSTTIGEGQTWTPGSDIYQFAGTVVDDGTVALVQIKVADAAWRDTNFGSDTWKVAVHVPGADGTVVPVRVRAYDLAGRFTEIASSSSVDTSPAGTQPYERVGTVITDGPGGVTRDPAATFMFAGTAGDDEVATFTCRLDDYQPTGCESPFEISELSAGMHTFTVAAIDAAGYADLSPATRSWTVTASGPQPDLVKRPPSETTQRSATFEFTAVTGATLQCALDTTVFEACTSPTVFSDVARGDHTFMVRATLDDVTGTAVSARWTVIDEAPIAYGQQVLVTTNDPLGAPITLVADDVDDLTYRVVVNPEFGFLEGTAPGLTYIPFADYEGPDRFAFVADDGQSVSDAAVVEVIVTTRANPPVIVVPAPVVTANAAPGEAYAVVDYDVSATDADTIAGPVTSLFAALLLTPVPVSCVPASGSRFMIGDTTVTCTATDVDDNTTTVSFIVRVVDDQHPILGAVDDQAVTIERRGDPVEFVVPDATDNSGVASVVCTPGSGSRLQVGASTISCLASDPSGNAASARFEVTVTAESTERDGTLLAVPTTTAPGAPGGTLPDTGNGGLPLRQALQLILAGLVLVLIAHRRRTSGRTG